LKSGNEWDEDNRQNNESFNVVFLRRNEIKRNETKRSFWIEKNKQTKQEEV